MYWDSDFAYGSLSLSLCVSTMRNQKSNRWTLKNLIYFLKLKRFLFFLFDELKKLKSVLKELSHIIETCQNLKRKLKVNIEWKNKTNNKRKIFKFESILKSFSFQKISIIYDNFFKVNFKRASWYMFLTSWLFITFSFLGLFIVFIKSQSHSL